jgi:hypothetical protein
MWSYSPSGTKPAHSGTCITQFIRHGAIRHLSATRAGNSSTKRSNNFLPSLPSNGSPQHHMCSANGQVENHNLTLKINSPHAQLQDNWDDHLGLCQFTYNTTVNSQTTSRPSSCFMAGKPANLTIWVWTISLLRWTFINMFNQLQSV